MMVMISEVNPTQKHPVIKPRSLARKLRLVENLFKPKFIQIIQTLFKSPLSEVVVECNRLTSQTIDQLTKQELLDFHQIMKQLIMQF
jgi:hypothetical protein